MLSENMCLLAVYLFGILIRVAHEWYASKKGAGREIRWTIAVLWPLLILLHVVEVVHISDEEDKRREFEKMVSLTPRAATRQKLDIRKLLKSIVIVIVGWGMVAALVVAAYLDPPKTPAPLCAKIVCVVMLVSFVVAVVHVAINNYRHVSSDYKGDDES